MSSFASAFAGGLLIGLSAALFLLLDGRIAGISGLVAGLARPAGEGPAGEAWHTGFAFLAGLVLGPPVFALLAGGRPAMRIEASLPVLALAGLLVGFGTRLGSGCTSGHGVCGLARLSPRSAVAVAVFLASGMLTVALGRVLA
ncbi:YeeE/YedE family protein [Methylobacterium sp. Gmos1]